MAKKGTKKVTKKEEKKIGNSEIRIKIWKIVHFVIIMATILFIAVSFARAGVHNVWWGYEGHYTDLPKSLIDSYLKSMTEYALTTVGVYVVLQTYYYVLYLFKLKKTLYVSMLVSIVVLFTDLVAGIDLFAVAFPVVSVLIYMRLLKLEERK